MVPLGPLVAYESGLLGEVARVTIERFGPVLAVLIGVGFGALVISRIRATVRGYGGARAADAGRSVAGGSLEAGSGAVEAIRDRRARKDYHDDDGMLTRF
jgi:hypothetical protein